MHDRFVSFKKQASQMRVMLRPQSLCARTEGGPDSSATGCRTRVAHGEFEAPSTYRFRKGYAASKLSRMRVPSCSGEVL